MGNRIFEFCEEEYYHVYNRGVEGRNIFEDSNDLDRFWKSLKLFNDKKVIGSIYEKSFEEIPEVDNRKELVDIICYCLNPNHFHLLLKQKEERGISTFMHRIGGYTWFFNHKHKRKGSLFQGAFKAKHIENNDYLLHVSAYINLNSRVHQLGGETAKLSESSWDEYTKEKVASPLCKTRDILEQFANKKEYREFCEDSLELMLSTKEEAKELRTLMLED